MLTFGKPGRLLPALLVVLAAVARGAEILVVPVDGSHWVNMKVLLEELARRGHSLTVLHSSSARHIRPQTELYRSLAVPGGGGGGPLGILEDREMMSNLVLETLEIFRGGHTALAFVRNRLALGRMLRETHKSVGEFIGRMFEDRRLMKRLEGGGFQLVLSDPLYPVGLMLARRLGLPLVLNARWLSSGDCHQLIAPSPPSYVPVVGSRLTHDMSFWQRLSNAIQYATTVVLTGLMVDAAYDGLCKRYLGPEVSLTELTLAADLWLMRVDFVLDFPRPTMPNVVYIGGFQCRPASPLDPELEEFVAGSGEQGVVLMSLGTMVTTLPQRLAESIAQALSTLPQRVVWLYSAPPPSGLGNNTRVLSWAPQNDLLGHPKTVAFISHGGTNGVYEAIYHGVPVVGIPLVFDQFDNLARLEARGAAVVLDATSLRPEELAGAVRRVTGLPRYAANMRRLSELHRDRPHSPLQLAAHWVEFVLRHGGAAHLRPHAFQLPWYVYHGLDVAAFLAAIFATASLLLLLCLRALWRGLRGVKEKRE